MMRGRTGRTIAVTIALLLATSGAATAEWSFTEVSAAAGVNYGHGFPGGFDSDVERMVAGAAAEDVDGDGLLDLYILRGEGAPDVLLRNLGNGTFAPFASQPPTTPFPHSGAMFADLDGDGLVDLVVGSVPNGLTPPAPKLFRNTGGGVFVAEPGAGGLADGRQIFSTAAADYDRDGDLDLAVAHWSTTPGMTLRRNDGAMTFTDVTFPAGIPGGIMFGFTPNFVDFDGDGWLDLLAAADFSTSAIFLNDQDGTFTRTNDPAITDENGMGAAVADYDRDGDLDWFVSSIWDPDQDNSGYNWGVSGNRLYRNDGAGTCDDETVGAGVLEGWWGWGSCFADFDNDGIVDLFHTNGWSAPEAPEFHADPSRLYMGQAGGGFVEESAARGIVETDQGRGVVCFDYDRDGDIDVLVANNDGPVRLYRNDGGNSNNSLTVRLAGNPPNTLGVGAMVYVTAGGSTQMQQVRAGSNYVSSDPSEVHFGLGGSTTVTEVRIEWPLGGSSVLGPLAADQLITVSEGPPLPPAVPRTHTVAKLDPAGTSLRVDWNATACSGAVDHRIVWGYRSSLPATTSGVWAGTGAVCSIGTGGSHTWAGSPDPTLDPDGLVWWVVIADDGGVAEGSAGTAGDGLERRGSGADGSSGFCGATRRDLATGCLP